MSNEERSWKKYKENQGRKKGGRKSRPNKGPNVKLMIVSALAVAIVVWLLRTHGYL